MKKVTEKDLSLDMCIKSLHRFQVRYLLCSISRRHMPCKMSLNTVKGFLPCNR